MSLQVAVTRLPDITQFPVEALIIPIVSWEDFLSPEHSRLRERTGGYYHQLLANLVRYGLHRDLPLILLKDDRPDPGVTFRYVAFVFEDDWLDMPQMACYHGLEALSEEGVRSVALRVPIGSLSDAEYGARMLGMRFALNAQRLTRHNCIRNVLLSVDTREAEATALRRLGDLRARNHSPLDS